MLILALHFIVLTGPDQQHILINPGEVVSVRVPREETHFAPGTRCLLHMADGKFIAVVETCDEVRRVIEEGESE